MHEKRARGEPSSFLCWVTSGNRTHIAGTTTRSNNRYTIVTIYVAFTYIERQNIVYIANKIFKEKQPQIRMLFQRQQYRRGCGMHVVLCAG